MSHINLEQTSRKAIEIAQGAVVVTTEAAANERSAKVTEVLA
jgi:hypothetical protein